jgi:iron complex outermembrane recepter protein
MLGLFPLDRRRRLARDVIHNTRDPGDLVDDAKGDVGEEIVGEFGPVGRHEFQFDTHPIRYLTLALNGSYTDAVLTRGATAEQYAANPTLGLTGERIPEVARFQFAVSGDYTAPIYRDILGTVAADLTYRGSEDSYFQSTSFNVPLESYALLNLRTGVTAGQWRVMLYARNVTDKRAQVSAVNNPVTPLSLITVRPRTIGMSVTRQF